MKQRTATWQNRAFLLAFFVLTLFCWCPLGYGSYGPVPRLLGIPSWAVVVLAVALPYWGIVSEPLVMPVR